MSHQRSDGNVHGLDVREAKPSQGDRPRPVSELFRLDNRTIISEVEHAAKKYDRRLTYCSPDATNEDAVRETFAKFMPALRLPLKGLVACAGLSRNGPATEFPIGDFRRVPNTNVGGGDIPHCSSSGQRVDQNQHNRQHGAGGQYEWIRIQQAESGEGRRADLRFKAYMPIHRSTRQVFSTPIDNMNSEKRRNIVDPVT
ncbi:short-chain dehydrogenase [Penicillium alfredii]|uniref:Short-chain dehydrogenase n=1 Tax=Penicillium alfredii TaxID=1506179 RepID=A0A9W9FRY4_9EURO|nr:short-chain dehydrogenase [Penicillium alfredii]KAJ5105341.1 short-chain dehydrogenase [Penicillium alfredii]